MDGHTKRFSKGAELCGARKEVPHGSEDSQAVCTVAGEAGVHTERAQSRNVHQVIISHVQEHSRKPNEARRRIEALMGDVPRVELFARRPAPGWDVWGNEVDSTIDWAPT